MVPQNSYTVTSKITDHRPTKQFETLQELPKCDADMAQANMVGKNGSGRLDQYVGATNLHCAKDAVSVKYNKVKHNQKKYVCIKQFFLKYFYVS